MFYVFDRKLRYKKTAIKSSIRVITLIHCNIPIIKSYVHLFTRVSRYNIEFFILHGVFSFSSFDDFELWLPPLHLFRLHPPHSTEYHLQYLHSYPFDDIHASPYDQSMRKRTKGDQKLIKKCLAEERCDYINKEWKFHTSVAVNVPNNLWICGLNTEYAEKSPLFLFSKPK